MFRQTVRTFASRAPTIDAAGNVLKRPLSPFMLFSNAKRPELQKKFPDLIGIQLGPKLGEAWRTATEQEKSSYQSKYEKALKEYKSKVVTPPKRPLTAFLLYSNENRSRAASSLPKDHSITDIAKALGQMWRAASVDEKKKYEQLADKAKHKYETEKAAFDKKFGEKIASLSAPKTRAAKEPKKAKASVEKTSEVKAAPSKKASTPAQKAPTKKATASSKKSA
jgi:hypothetical protein